MLLNKSRVHIFDETSTVYEKTAAQIDTEKQAFNNLLSKLELKVDISENDENRDAVLKTAMQEGDSETLKALLSKKRETEAGKSIGAHKPVSLNFGVVGSGQAGGRLAEVMYDFGYDVVCLNTARQDLELLDVPAANKFHMDYSVGSGGSGKNLDVGRAAIEAYSDQVKELIEQKLHNIDVYLAVFSLGGGSGAGSAETLINILSDFGKPVICICAIPGSFDDTQSKYNAIHTLAKLSDQSSSGKINSLILVDNAQIEKNYPNLSQADFWNVSNLAIVSPLHMFNSVSARPTNLDALDSADYSLALLESGGCTVFSSNKISKEQYLSSDLGLVEGIVDNLNNGLLASDFDLKEAQKVGVLVTANEKVLSQIPYSNIAFIFKYISEEFGSAASFRGIYSVASQDDDITIQMMFSGMGLPRQRVEALKEDAQKNMDALLAKKNTIGDKMTIDLGKEKKTSAADSMMDKIKKNKSAVGKLMGNKKPVDRRR